jgi:thiol:disulfide interchange protein DsbC
VETLSSLKSRRRFLALPLPAAGILLSLALLAGNGAAAADGAVPDTPGAVPADPAPAADLPPLQPCPVIGNPASPVPPMPAGLGNTIRERIRHRIGGTVTEVCRMPFGLYEAAVDGEILYVDERVNYLLAGNAFDLRTKENLTAARKEDITRVDFKSLPLQNAVKTVRGSGARVLAVFEDPNCPYCKRFEKDIATLDNTTIYTFLYPILSRDVNAADDSYPKSRAVWCAADRTAAWSQVMIEGRHLPAAAASCKHPLDEILALGQKLHITGTPTLLFTDGRRAPGAIPLDEVERRVAAAGPYPVPALAPAPAALPVPAPAPASVR